MRPGEARGVMETPGLCAEPGLCPLAVHRLAPGRCLLWARTPPHTTGGAGAAQGHRELSLAVWTCAGWVFLTSFFRPPQTSLPTELVY